MQTNRGLLITLPHYDAVTRYLAAWSKSVMALALEKRIPVYDLKGDAATRARFESYVSAQKPSCIFLNGHGNAREIAGHKDEVIVDRRSAVGAPVIYARSCDAGQILGQLLVDKDGATFIGYTRKFIFGYTPDYMTRPLKDTMAALFLEPSNVVVSTLLKGNMAQEAHTRSKAAMYRSFRRMISSAASYEERYAARWLWGNITSQVLIGDPQRKI